MNIRNYIKPECIEINAVFEDKDDAIRQIASIAKRSETLAKIPEKKIYDKMMDREKLSTTGFGRAIAIPHCAIEGIDDFVIGIVTLPQGVEFASFDKKPVKLIVFIVLPADKRTEHVRVLSRISNSLKEDNNIQELIASKSSEVLLENFLRQTYIDEKMKEDKEYNLFTITIQIEDAADEILNVLAEIPECSITVIEGDNAGKYLYNQPLFTNLWSAKSHGFHLVVMAVAKKSISNEIIRKINSIIHDHSDKPGIMMLVQNLFYVNGSLDV
ncbi:MAG: PTS sugar transporter subunit IIA [Candidatus Marinimicrobia bacterium]|nr:PTS sugar transporter subunit IIA [Candidatus Neomarinimicrobiota bacterium]